MSAAAARANDLAAGATYVGTRPSAVGTGAIPVLYFTVDALESWSLADGATAVAVGVGISKRAELANGFDLVVTENGGTSGVRLSFDATTAVSTDWSGLTDQFSSVSFPIAFDLASSYEWFPGSDWINTTDPNIRDADDRLPPASTFPRAHFDEAAVRRIVSEVDYQTPYGDSSITSSLTITGGSRARRVIVALRVQPDVGETVGGATTIPMVYILRRLSADPTLAAIEFHLYLSGLEQSSLVFAHERLASVDWASFRVNDDGVIRRVFQLATNYRWVKDAWRAELVADGMTARQFPLSKP
jgi:hypothetical protein